MKALVHCHGSSERDALADWEPVEVAQHWRDVLALPGPSEQTRGRVLHSLQSVQDTVADAGQQNATVIESAADEGVNERLDHVESQ